MTTASPLSGLMPLPPVAPTALATGLDGVVGGAYRRGANQVIVVEYDGDVLALDLVRAAGVVSSGATTLHGTYLFDFDSGLEGVSGDVWWDQQTAVLREMAPQGSALIVNLGAVDYDALSAASLQALSYGTAPIIGNDDASNQLVPGDVFAVRTNGGNYAKVRIDGYGYDLQIEWVTYALAPATRLLGTGYSLLEDIALSADERTAYVTERAGNLLRVDLANADRANATVVSAGMTAPHQIALDEAHGHAYVVEFADPGRLLRIDLASGAQTVVLDTLSYAIGLLLTSDLRFAYVTEQLADGRGQLSRIELSTGRRELLYTSATAPLFFLSWAGAGESAIYMTERDPANQVLAVDLTTATPSVSTLASGVPFRPSDVVVIAPDRLALCCDAEIDELDLAGGVYTASGPMLLGIGHVPADRVNAAPADPRYGYADTTVDPAYFFQVRDTPFGGALPLQFNHDRAFGEGALYYRVLVDGAPFTQTWSDYLWDTASDSFVLQTIVPFTLSGNPGYYLVRNPADLWYNHWLGYMLDTSGLSNDLHSIAVQLFDGTVTEIGSAADPGRSMVVRVENRLPTAVIDTIWHDSSAVGTCGIVNGGSDQFTFDVTATHPGGALLSWSLSALWGDDGAASVASDSYANHAAAGPLWTVPSTSVPAAPWSASVPGDPTSRWCAHTFYLWAWDRVIDGFGYVHPAATYHKSVTIMLP